MMIAVAEFQPSPSRGAACFVKSIRKLSARVNAYDLRVESHRNGKYRCS